MNSNDLERASSSALPKAYLYKLTMPHASNQWGLMPC